MEEREIDLVDLLTDILSHWRGILACMLAGAILLGVFSYVRSYQGAGSTINGQASQNDMSLAERIQELEELLSNTERIAVYTVIDDEREYAVYQQYMESSVLMQMDPNNISIVNLLFKVQADDMGQSYRLRSVYEDLVNGIGICQWAEEQTGISSAAAAELISTQMGRNVALMAAERSSTQSGRNAALMNGTQESEIGSDCLNVTVIHYDSAECERLAQCVKDYIKQQNGKLSQELGAHEVVLLSESAGIVMGTEIRDSQLLCSNTQINLLTNCAKAVDEFTENQQMYYELLKEQDEISGDPEGVEETADPETTVQTAANKPSVSLKYVAVGAVLFAFIYAVILFVLYILNGKLRAADELQRLYNISQLGLIVKDGGKKKFFIDKWIDTMRNWNKRQFTREQSLELAAAAIKISAGKQELGRVCLMGCDLKAGADVVCQELKERLGKENITVQILDNVLYDAETMEALESTKGIVLVEKAMSTMYNEILRELELASRQGITVLGGIVVE